MDKPALRRFASTPEPKFFLEEPDNIIPDSKRRYIFKPNFNAGKDAFKLPEKPPQETLTQRQNIELLLDSKNFTIALSVVVIIALIITIIDMYGLEMNTEVTGWIEFITTIVFTIDVTCRLFAIGPKRYFTNKMCWLDFLVTAADWTVYLLSYEGGLSNQLVILRLLRTFRLSKMTRLARLSDHAEQLRESQNEEPAIQADAKGRIYAYDADNLFSMGIFGNLSGTVVALPEMWIQFMFLILATTIWGISICRKECDSTSSAFDPTADCPACIVGFSTSTGFIFSSLVSFLLGIFNSMTFNSWWRTRVSLEHAMQQVTSSALWLTSYVPSMEPHVLQYKLEITRYQVLALYIHVNELEENSNYLHGLVEDQLLTVHELEIIQEVDKPHEHVLCWAASLLTQMAANGMFMYNPHAIVGMHNRLCNQRQQMADMTLSVTTQIPYTYTHLMTIIVKFHLLMVTAVAGTFCGQGVHDGSLIDIVWGYTLVTLSNIVLEGLLRIHVVLYNPFGEDACDFSSERLLGGMRNSAFGIYEMATKLPYQQDGRMVHAMINKLPLPALQIQPRGKPACEASDKASSSKVGSIESNAVTNIGHSAKPFNNFVSPDDEVMKVSAF